MTVTGYQAPRSAVLHRPYVLRFATSTIYRTFCGIDLPPQGWNQEATGPQYNCRHCHIVHARQQRARAPWAEGEPRRYTQRRHPGLYIFTRDIIERRTIGYHWRLLATPRPGFRMTKDQRAPQERPWRLCAGDVYDRAVGYFPGTWEAVEFTKQVEAAGLLVPLIRQVDTDTWNEHTDSLSFLDRAALKETNPA